MLVDEKRLAKFYPITFGYENPGFQTNIIRSAERNVAHRRTFVNGLNRPAGNRDIQTLLDLDGGTHCLFPALFGFWRPVDAVTTSAPHLAEVRNSFANLLMALFLFHVTTETDFCLLATVQYRVGFGV